MHWDSYYIPNVQTERKRSSPPPKQNGIDPDMSKTVDRAILIVSAQSYWVFFVLRNWNLFDLKKWELHCVNAQRRPSNAMKVQSLLPPSRWNVPWQSKAKEYYGHTSVRNSIFHSVRDNQQSSVKNQSFSDGICYAGIWFDSSKHFERAAAIIFPFECGIWGNESFAIRKSQKSIHFHEYFDMMCVTGAVNLKIIYAILICI